MAHQVGGYQRGVLPLQKGFQTRHLATRAREVDPAACLQVGAYLSEGVAQVALQVFGTAQRTEFLQGLRPRVAQPEKFVEGRPVHDASLPDNPTADSIEQSAAGALHLLVFVFHVGGVHLRRGGIGVSRTVEGAHPFAQPALYAGLLVYLGVEEAFLVGSHGDAPLGAGGEAGCASAAFCFIKCLEVHGSVA